jgi:hypothetical protein
MSGGVDLADVFRDGAARFELQYGHMISREQHQVIRAVLRCRTAALGGHLHRCQDCGHEQIHYNSCRNRHCPKCQALARSAWVSQREAELLPVAYFHLVFTMPHELGPLALQNKRVVYGILFRAAAETISELAADPKHLGATPGCLMVLHTWGQNLMHHPHVHAIVTGGGISPDGTRWVHCKHSKKSKKKFFIAVSMLGAVFRGKFIAYLKQAFAAGQLDFHGQLQPYANSAIFEWLLRKAVRRDWVVYAKRPFASPTCVLKYLAGYTHRVAISNQRLIDIHEGRVRFHYKDYAHAQQAKVMTLSTDEMMRRFLMHTLPSRFVRIRYYGFLANRCRQRQLQRCRELLGAAQPPTVADKTQPNDDLKALTDTKSCPVCKTGVLIIIELPQPVRPPHFISVPSPQPVYNDSS